MPETILSLESTFGQAMERPWTVAMPTSAIETELKEITPPERRRAAGIKRTLRGVGKKFSLFSRIFVLVLGVVICAQVINFGLILLVRMPHPDTYSIVEIARALSEGKPPSGRLSVSIGAPPAESALDARDRRAQAALAQELGIAVDAVRFRIGRPPTFLFGDKKSHSAERSREADGAERQGRAPKGSAHDAPNLTREDVIVGSFSAAMRLDNGRWLVIGQSAGWLEPWQWQIILWFLGTLVVTVPFAWIMSRRIAQPVRLFSEAAERLGCDPTRPPLSLGAAGSPEIAAATSAFNVMQGRLKRYVDDRTTMAAAIAHDLRTPLMRLSLLVENAPNAIRLPAVAEIREMNDRIRTTLAFVRDVNVVRARRRLDLRAALGSVVDAMVDIGADVTMAQGPDIVVEADLAGMKALVRNLIENAVRYAGSARVSLTSTDGNAIVEVEDDGSGIPPEEMERVFSPFYRLESSRSRDTGGAGLGLASARSVARAHGGDIVLRNRPEGGLTAIVTLPIMHRGKASP